MQTLYGQRTQYFYKQTSHSTCQVGQLQVRQPPQNVRKKTVFDDSSTDDSSSEEEEEDQDTVDARNQEYTEDVHDDDAETEAPQQQTLEETPEQTPEQSGALPTMLMLMIPLLCQLTAEEMVILTSGDEELQLNRRRTSPWKCSPLAWMSSRHRFLVSGGSFCFPLTTLLLFIYVFAKYYVSFQLLLKLWRTVHQRLGMQSSSFSTNLNLNWQQYVMLHRLQVGPLTLPQCRLHHLQVGLHKVQHQVTFFQLCCLVIGFTNSCFFPLLFVCFDSFLALPGFVKAVIRNVVDSMWGHEHGLAPLILPPYPSQYCFPEGRAILTNLNTSSDSSNKSGW